MLKARILIRDGRDCWSCATLLGGVCVFGLVSRLGYIGCKGVTFGRVVYCRSSYCCRSSIGVVTFGIRKEEGPRQSLVTV